MGAVVDANRTRKDFVADEVLARVAGVKSPVVGVYRLTTKTGSDKVMSEKVTSFALCLRSSLWVSQASLCNTVLQNF